MAWFTAPSGVTCQCAYDAVGAASLADSYVNEANPGTYTAAPGVAPTWAYGTGWTFNGTTQYLTTGYVPSHPASMIVRFSGTTGGNAAGVYSAVGGWIYFLPNGSTGIRYRYGSTAITVSPVLSTGVVAIAAGQGYRNGVADGASLGSSGAATGAIAIGVLNETPALSSFFVGNIQALAIYSGTLTAADVVAITAAMNALGAAAGGGVVQRPFSSVFRGAFG